MLNCRATGWIAVCALLLASALLPVGTLGLAQFGSRTFPETGRTVSDLFLQYWDEHGGLAQQGYPISTEMKRVSETDGNEYLMQYFERAVFEFHPESVPGHFIQLSLLGVFRYREKYPNGAPGQQPNNEPGSRLFPETGKRLGGVFLDYWTRHGGLQQQGFPISDEFTEVSDLDGNSYRVQYFERAVFELHPENQPPHIVLLSQLGTYQYRKLFASGQAATGKIAFSSRRDGNWEIYLMNADGSSVKNLTNHPSGDRIPSWSPDGKQVAFFSDRDGGEGRIFIMGADGANPRRLTNSNRQETQPSWSPDGSRIAFSSQSGNDLFVVSTDGTDLRGLNIPQNTVRLMAPQYPTWSPDGKRLAFMAEAEQQDVELFAVDADGSNLQRLTNSPRQDGLPTWLKSGRIGFASERAGTPQIYTMNPDGSDVRPVAPGQEAGHPTFSPDGKFLAFVNRVNSQVDVFTMRSDGSNVFRITDHPADDWLPAWSPTP